MHNTFLWFWVFVLISYLKHCIFLNLTEKWQEIKVSKIFNMFNFEEEKKRKFCFELNFNYIKYLTSKNDKYLYLPETINKKNKKASFLCFVWSKNQRFLTYFTDIDMKGQSTNCGQVLSKNQVRHPWPESFI